MGRVHHALDYFRNSFDFVAVRDGVVIHDRRIHPYLACLGGSSLDLPITLRARTALRKIRRGRESSGNALTAPELMR